MNIKFNNRHKLIAFLIFVLFMLLVSVFVVQVAVIAQPNKTHYGFSGYISTQTQLDKIVQIMNNQSLDTYRVSFTPSWKTPQDSLKGYNSTIIDYLLNNTSFFIVVDGNHLYPAGNLTSQDASDHWTQIRERNFQILGQYPNNPRVAVELINEYKLPDFNTKMQGLIDEIRQMGYTNPIVLNKLDTDWVKLSDPLDNTYQGMHFFFNTWTVSGAIEQMQMAKAMGITKILNTEIGATFNEYRDFDQTNVGDLQSFLVQSKDLGVSNCVWLNLDNSNWQTYADFNLAVNPKAANP